MNCVRYEFLDDTSRNCRPADRLQKDLDFSRILNQPGRSLGNPTNDLRLMTKAATEAVNRLFRPGFKYCKAEALLLDLRQLGEFTYDLYPYCSLLWLTKSWGAG